MQCKATRLEAVAAGWLAKQSCRKKNKKEKDKERGRKRKDERAYHLSLNQQR